MIRKLVCALVCVVLYMIEVFLKFVTNVYGFVAVWFWRFMAVASIWAIWRHLWKHLIITGTVSVIVFVGLFICVLIQGSVKDIRKWLWG